MKFYDKVDISISSGKWWDGAVAARREKGAEFWGPAGWNGGKWWDVIFQASQDVNTLIDFRYLKQFAAKLGEWGRIKEQYGKNAEDLILLVPVGTVISDHASGKVLAQLLEHNQQYIWLEGGKGGTGNMHFKSNMFQYPSFALKGEPWQTKKVQLELQLLWDIALIGTPSVGKSTLINAVSNVKAKVADYPFTTLIPNLGSVKVGNYSFNIVDVPGLIEGAHEGKGLGNAFLRHILKAKIFCFMLDITRYESWVQEFGLLLEEILLYIENRFGDTYEHVQYEINLEEDFPILRIFGDGTLLLEKMIMWVVNKYDQVDDKEILKEYLAYLVDHIQWVMKKSFKIRYTKKACEKVIKVLSGLEHTGTKEWIQSCAELLKTHHFPVITMIDAVEIKKEKQETLKDVTEQEMPFLLEQSYIQEQDVEGHHVWEITDTDFVRLTYMLMWGNDEAEIWFWMVMEKQWIMKKCFKAWLIKGDIFKVISPYEGIDDRYIKY